MKRILIARWEIQVQPEVAIACADQKEHEDGIRMGDVMVHSTIGLRP